MVENLELLPACKIRSFRQAKPGKSVIDHFRLVSAVVQGSAMRVLEVVGCEEVQAPARQGVNN